MKARQRKALQSQEQAPLPGIGRPKLTRAQLKRVREQEQYNLPGMEKHREPVELSSREIRAIVKHNMYGFEIRQAARLAKRKAKGCPNIQ